MSHQEASAVVANVAATSVVTIGGSEAAAAVGLDPYCSRVELWARKTGRIPATEGNEAMLWGTLLEPVIRQQVESHGYHVLTDVWGAAAGVPVRQDAAWMTGHLDGIVQRGEVAADPERSFGTKATIEGGVYEGKTAGHWTAHHWNDGGAPPGYVVQLHHYMILTGLTWGLLACLVAGQKLEIREIERDEGLCALILELEAEFVDYCEKDTPPPPDGSDATTEVLKRLYSTPNGEIVTLTADDAAKVSELRQIKKQAKTIAEQQAQLENELKVRLGEATAGVYEGTKLVSWPEIVAQVKATEAHERRYRRFQIHGS